MKLRFYEAAELEFDDAIAFYESESPGLGRKYHDAVREALARIKQFPRAFPPLSQQTRRCLVHKFPYGIIYQVSTDEILIIAIAHLHRKPEYWESRE